jgi:hypothetical protein
MALQGFSHGFLLPAPPHASSQAPSVSLVSVSNAAFRVANVFQATAAKSIRKVHFRTSTVTTGDTLDIRIETVDTGANGDPTGTLWAANTNGACVVAKNDDNVWKEATLTADASLAVGDVFAIVAVSGGSANMNFTAYGDQAASFPYADVYNGTSWAKDDNAVVLVAEYSDGSFEPLYGYLDVGAVNNRTFKSDDATNRRGNIFQVPFPTRAKGAWAFVDGDATFTIKLYNAAGTEMKTTAATNAFQRSAATPGLYFLPFTAGAEALSAGTNYRIAVVPGTTSNIVAYDFDVPVAGMLDMFPGGQEVHGSVFTSSAWVETTTARAYCGVILDAFDDAVGAGGGGNANIFHGSVIR